MNLFRTASGSVLGTCKPCRPVTLKTKGGHTYVKNDKAQCRVCGCTNQRHCFNCHGANTKCFWVTAAENLCSRCAGVTLTHRTAPSVAEPQGECDGPL